MKTVVSTGRGQGQESLVAGVLEAGLEAQPEASGPISSISGLRSVTWPGKAIGFYF